MKKLVKVLLVALLAMTLVACGESCEHANTTTTYSEGDWLDIEKIITCNDCGKEVSEESLRSIEYIYNKEIINEKGIKVVLDKLIVDGWDMMELQLTVEGNSDKKRNFESYAVYVNGTDTNAWIYADNLSGNRNSKIDHYLYDTVATVDFLKSQDHKVEMEYTITDPSNYKTLKEGTVSFNLNEFTSINEVEE